MDSTDITVFSIYNTNFAGDLLSPAVRLVPLPANVTRFEWAFSPYLQWR
jgi:hypothetical protein